MADAADIANDYAEQELRERLHGRVQYRGNSQKECDDCGCEIPLLRRAGDVYERVGVVQ